MSVTMQPASRGAGPVRTAVISRVCRAGDQGGVQPHSPGVGMLQKTTSSAVVAGLGAIQSPSPEVPSVCTLCLRACGLMT